MKPTTVTSPQEAVALLKEQYAARIAQMREYYAAFKETGATFRPEHHPVYPELRVTVLDPGPYDTSLSYGFIEQPGTYSASITRPELFENYLIDLLERLQTTHVDDLIKIEIADSKERIPVDYAVPNLVAFDDERKQRRFQRLFHQASDKVRDYTTEKDEDVRTPSGHYPLLYFPAERVDMSCNRFQHYTGTAVGDVQGFVILTNYDFYMQSFKDAARDLLADPASGYKSLVESGNVVTTCDGVTSSCAQHNGNKNGQMSAIHLKRDDGLGITLINIGVGAPNAETITDHVAVLRPHLWLMAGHAGGLRDSLKKGDAVIPSAYHRMPGVYDRVLAAHIPIPALSEPEVALKDATAQITGLERDSAEFKRATRTGTVSTSLSRHWAEDAGLADEVRRSRSMAIDMETGVIAAAGFRYRVPYGARLVVTDLPFHKQPKLAADAQRIYDKKKREDMLILIRTCEILRQPGLLSKLPSRKIHAAFDRPCR